MNDRTAISGPQAAPASKGIFTLLHAAHALEEKLESTLAGVGLSSPKFSVLSELVSAGEALSLSELASRLSCVRSNMTQLVDRLEADGLVRRVSCPTDRRSVKAEITSLGRERQVAGAEVMDALHSQFSSRVAQDDLGAVARMLSALE